MAIISENFSKIYFDLMKGEGRLRLEMEGDINSGLIIEATTETKKILNIDAMSGGEKTLTALGFLFAIQAYHASPFYILDEIDAALDKVNTKKISDFIKKYSQETQFIVISHNDITIQTADNVFGVSMEDGVSKIFSIRMPGAQEGKEMKPEDKEEEEESWEGAEKADSEEKGESLLDRIGRDEDAG
jgi:chromosome segregation protein